MLKIKIMIAFSAVMICQSVFANDQQNQQIAQKIAYAQPFGIIQNAQFALEHQERQKQNKATLSNQDAKCILNHTNDQSYAKFLLPKVAKFTKGKTKKEVQSYIDVLSNKELVNWTRNFSLSHLNLAPYPTDYYVNQFDSISAKYKKDMALLVEVMSFGKDNITSLSPEESYQKGVKSGQAVSNEYIASVLKQCGIKSLI